MPVYIEGTDIKLKKNNLIFVDAEFISGEVIEGLLPRRLFPVNSRDKYIALMDDEEEIVCIIRDIDTMLPDSKAVLIDALEEYYIVPKITKVYNWKEEYGYHIWSVETDHGKLNIEISDSTNQVIRLQNDRVLIKDSSDNRYEIPDLNALDPRSVRKIMADI